MKGTTSASVITNHSWKIQFFLLKRIASVSVIYIPLSFNMIGQSSTNLKKKIPAMPALQLEVTYTDGPTGLS